MFHRESHLNGQARFSSVISLSAQVYRWCPLYNGYGFGASVQVPGLSYPSRLSASHYDELSSSSLFLQAVHPSSRLLCSLVSTQASNSCSGPVYTGIQWESQYNKTHSPHSKGKYGKNYRSTSSFQHPSFPASFPYYLKELG